MVRSFLPSVQHRFTLISAVVFLLCVSVASTQQPAQSQADQPQPPNPPATPPVEMNKREQALAAALSGATLQGNFTVTGRNEGDLPQLSAESYTLGEVRKVAKGRWLIPARIKYGDKDVTLPLTLPVKWAGDTAVIIVDNVGFPGLGTYSARVLIHDGRYAGYWAGADHGGHLFGEVKKAEQ